MKFFEQQRRAKQKTGWLVILFLMAVVLISLAVGMMVALVFVSQSADAIWDYSETVISVMLWASAITFCSILIVSLGKIILLGNKTGYEIAEALGAVQVNPNTKDPLEKRLYNVVEEMSLAAGIPVPYVYVLKTESGINAFAAGIDVSGAAVAVTKGTLEKLSRDELQGVIAHEFGHIFNGDMKLNIRLIGVLAGIQFISLIGREMMSAGGKSRSRGKRDGGGIVLIGLVLFVVGLIGLFFARLIQASVSREREYLSDASAVQYTRNPMAFEMVLKKIWANSSENILKQTPNAEAYAHMFFSTGINFSFFTRMFATHPDLGLRIKAVNPQFSPISFIQNELDVIKQKLTRASDVEVTDEKGQKLANIGRNAMTAVGMMAAIGDMPDARHLAISKKLIDEIPSDLKDSLNSATSAEAILLSLLLSKNNDERSCQLALLSERKQSVLEAFASAVNLPARLRLPVIDLAIASLKWISLEQKNELLALIEKLVRFDQKISPFEFLVFAMIREAFFPTKAPVRAVAKEQYLADARLILSIVAYLGVAEPKAAQKSFRVGMKEVTLADVAIHLPSECRFEKLDLALNRMVVLSNERKESLIKAVLKVIEFDREISVSEVEIMRTICTIMRVPMLPIDVGSVGEHSGS